MRWAKGRRKRNGREVTRREEWREGERKRETEVTIIEKGRAGEKRCVYTRNQVTIGIDTEVDSNWIF